MTYDVTAPPVEGPNYPPEGIISNLARWLFVSSPLPSAVYSIGAATATVAGIVGREFQAGGTGLNQNTMITGGSASGKDIVNSGPQRLFAAIDKRSIGSESAKRRASEYRGPTFASGQAVQRHLKSRKDDGKSLSFCSPVPEAGLKFENFAKPSANEAHSSLMSFILHGFMASGEGRELEGIAYSEASKNIEKVSHFAITYLCESTPSTLWGASNKQLIRNGFLPRFSFYEEKTLPDQVDEIREIDPPIDLVKQFERLIAIVRALEQGGKPHHVSFDPDATAILKSFRAFCHDMRRNVLDDITNECYGRSHLKALKLAGLAAVAANPEQPIATLEHAIWGMEQSKRDVATLLDAVEHKIGVNTAETDHDRQAKYVLGKVVRWTVSRYSDLPVDCNEGLHIAKIVPYRFLRHQCLVTAGFKNDNNPTLALDRALQSLIKEGYIEEIVDQAALKPFGVRSQRCFMLIDKSAI